MAPRYPILLFFACLALVSFARAAGTPPEETAFIAAVQKYMKPYGDAKNELQKSALRKKRAVDLESALGGKLEAMDWVGVLTALRTTSDGDAYITVSIGKDIDLRTRNFKSRDDTLIKFGTPLFDTLAEMEKGMKVRFSGTFFSGQDFVQETSLTESGSMSEPEFLFRFTSVFRQ